MGRKLNPAEAQQLGLDDPPRSGGKGKLSAQEAEALGLGGEGAAAPPPDDKPTFELPYPERPMQGLELDAKTRQPVGSLTGPANPAQAAAMALTRGLTFGYGAKAAAGAKSIAPEFLGGGGSYEDNLKDYRNGEAVNSAAYPKFEKPYELYGAMKNPILKVLGGIGSAASGVSGVALRALGAMGMGGAASYLSTLGGSDRPADDPQLQEKARHNAMVGAPLALAAQLGIGEPVRAVGGAIAGRIAGSDARVQQAAEEAIASAQGQRGKQAQEAVGGGRNIRLEQMLERNAPPAEPVLDPPLGSPSLERARAARSPEALHNLNRGVQTEINPVSDTVAGRGAERMAKIGAEPLPPLRGMSDTAPRPVARGPMSPADAAAGRVGSGMNDLRQRGLDNAVRAIEEERNNPVQVPGMDTAIRGAEGAANAAAWGQARQGLGDVAFGVGMKAIGNPMGMGSYNLHHGVRQVVRAAFEAPAVLNRLRGIPGIGRSIGNAAGKGSAALEAVLFTHAKHDPMVAAELQKIQGEMAPLRPAQEEE